MNCITRLTKKVLDVIKFCPNCLMNATLRTRPLQHDQSSTVTDVVPDNSEVVTANPVENAAVSIQLGYQIACVEFLW